MAKVSGVADIQAKLRELPVRLQQNVLRSGNRAIAVEMVKRIKANPNLPPAIKKAVRSISNPQSRVTKGFVVGLRSPLSPLAHLFEFGTEERFHKPGGRLGGFKALAGKRGKSVGRMPATPFLRPVLDELGSDLSAQIWVKAAQRNFDLQMRKLARGGR